MIANINRYYKHKAEQGVTLTEDLIKYGLVYRTDPQTLRLTQAFEDSLDNTILKLGKTVDHASIAAAAITDFLKDRDIVVSDEQLDAMADHVMPLVGYFLRSNEGR